MGVTKYMCVDAGCGVTAGTGGVHIHACKELPVNLAFGQVTPTKGLDAQVHAVNTHHTHTLTHTSA